MESPVAKANAHVGHDPCFHISDGMPKLNRSVFSRTSRVRRERGRHLSPWAKNNLQ